MGCDIHGVFQRKTESGWQDVPTTFERNRHYYLFSVLAGVRNGFGFAGVPTYTPVVPIAAQRGFPADFEVEDESHPTTPECASKWDFMDETLTVPRIWMGDHSHSWLSGEEMLAWRPSLTWKTGILDRKVFDAWDGHSDPSDYCGGISGRDVRLAESPVEVDAETTHVRCCWPKPANELDYFFDEVRRLTAEHGEIRFVFGFDS